MEFYTKQIIGYSAYNTHLEAFEYNENECFIANSVESLKAFIDGAGFGWENYKIEPVWMSDILDDYGVSNGRFCMEIEALARFEKAARSLGVIYHTEDDIFLTFVEKNISTKSSAASLAFTIRFDLVEGGELNPPKRPEIVSWLVDEFMSNLPEEIRANWLKEIHGIKKDLKRIAEYRLDSQDVREGTLVSYINRSKKSESEALQKKRK